MSWLGKYFLDWAPVRAILPIRYYALALAVQKGAPILLLPVLAFYFGRENVAFYNLFYSTALLIGTFSGLGMPLGIVPLWHRIGKPKAFIQTAFAFSLAGSAAAGAILLGLLATGLFELQIGSVGATTLCAYLALFGFIYNTGQIASAICRIENRDRSFLAASVLGAVTLTGGALLLGGIDQAGLVTLIALQALGLLVASLVMLGKKLAWVIARPDVDLSVVHQLRSAALPLVANSGLVLFSMSVDKWAAGAFFPVGQFTDYVIDFQAAMAVLLIPAAIGLYIGPKLAEANWRGELSDMRKDIRTARWMTAAGSILAGLGLYLYGLLTGLGLTPFFWILIIKFSLEGQYLISSSIEMARGNFRRLVRALAVSNLVLLAALALASISRQVVFLYLAPVVYELALFLWITARLSIKPEGAIGQA